VLELGATKHEHQPGTSCQERARRSPIAPLEGVPETGLPLTAAVLPTGNRDHAEGKGGGTDAPTRAQQACE